jgi:hypothetical protein
MSTISPLLPSMPTQGFSPFACWSNKKHLSKQAVEKIQASYFFNNFN